MKIKHKKGVAELINADGKTFLLMGNVMKKITDKVEDITMEELTKAVEAQKQKKEVEIDPKVFKLLKKELGDFEIIL